MIKNEFNHHFLMIVNKMDQPKTRKETKKDQKQKGQGKDGKYSQKHIRQREALKEKHKSK